MTTITGTIHHIGPTETFGAKNFTKRVLVIKTSAKYNNLAPVDVTGDNCPKIDGLTIGQSIAVEVEVGGREYNGKYYGQNTYVSHVVKEQANHWQGQQEYPQMPEPSNAPIAEGAGDDLPF